ncbi:MAG TPA: hypothetical protein VHQ90_11395 [Thermoanaerobaculia bacterium]|nr:hypothetical protein [Thermoanaerobaculia bacterium]
MLSRVGGGAGAPTEMGRGAVLESRAAWAAGAALAVLAAISALLLAVGGCAPDPQRIADGTDPLAALAVPAASRVYDLAFWAREERAASRRWRSALAYCRGRSEETHPNCRNVRLAAWWEAPPPLPPLPNVQTLRELAPPRRPGGPQAPGGLGRATPGGGPAAGGQRNTGRGGRRGEGL